MNVLWLLVALIAGARLYVAQTRDFDQRAITTGQEPESPRVESTIHCSSYVSPTGSDTNSGTIFAPWRTALHAFDSAQPGQTICFREGTYPMAVTGRYSQTLNTSGTSSQRITITNYPGEVAILRGSTRVNGAYATFVGTPDSAPGLIFEGPTGPSENLDLVDVMDTHDVTFDHVEIRNGDYHAGFYQYGSYRITLVGAYVHDNGRVGYINVDNEIYWDETRGGGNLIANCIGEHNVADGIALYSGASPSQPAHVTVQGNTIVGNGHYGVEVGGSGNSVVNNIMAENGTVGNSPQMKISSGTDYFIDSNILWSSNSSHQGTYNTTGQNVSRAITRDPTFIDVIKHNYHLSADSPAIRAGNSKYASPLDRDGIKRSSIPEIGAYSKGDKLSQ